MADLHPHSTFTVEVYPHGIGIRGPLPASMLEALSAMAKPYDYDLIDTGVGGALGLTFFLTNKAGGAAMRAAIAERNAGKAPLEAWLAGADRGISSNTIVQALTGRVLLTDFGPDVPHDAGDFGRCRRLLEAVPEFRPRLAEVAALYPAWGPFVEAWDELTDLHLKGKWKELNRRIEVIDVR